MVPSLRTLLLGPPEHRFQRRLGLLFLVGVFVATFLAYAVGLFDVGGGVVFLAGDAAVVGLVGATYFGFQRSGLAFGWLAVYALLFSRPTDSPCWASKRSFWAPSPGAPAWAVRPSSTPAVSEPRTDRSAVLVFGRSPT